MVAWLYLPRSATYADIPQYRFSGSLMVWSIVAGVLIGLLAVFYVRLIAWVSHYRATGASILWMMPGAFLTLGVLGIWYPQLFGNGKDMAHDAFLGLGGIGLLFVLFALKPLVTALMLGSGAAGGVFTPFLATGALFGAFFGAAWSHMWPGTPVGAFALVGAAAMIGASMQAPLAGLVLVLELTHIGFSLVVPMMAATVIATVLVRHIDGYSIYSARLPRRDTGRAPTNSEGT
jgi:H+/Cl- antiporter ClcA